MGQKNRDRDDAEVTELFAVVNGEILKDLGESVSATYTRIHYLLRGLEGFSDIKIDSISYKQLDRRDVKATIYNNIIKTVVAIRTALRLIRKRPRVYFAYPHSLSTVQNRAVFRICGILGLQIVLDIHDTIEQISAIGEGKSRLNEDYESRCFRESAILLPSMDGPLWRRLKADYQIDDKKIVYVPNAFENEIIDYYPDPYKSMKDRFNICYIGGITRNRGVDLLVRACSDLHGKYPQLRLLLFGAYGDGIRSEIKNTIDNSDFITMKTIPRKEIPRAFNDIDLFAMPYNPHETYMTSITPTKFFEYIGAAKPMICTKCESLRDIGSDGSIMYVDYDLEDIELKIETLIRRPDLREEMSLKLEKIRRQHTWTERAMRIHMAICPEKG